MKHKSAIVRYHKLDDCFKNHGRNYTIKDLLEECNKELDNQGIEGIKKRQLYKDIEYMTSSQGWSIELEKIKSGRRVYYRYEDSRFSIKNSKQLNETQKQIIKENMIHLKTLSGAPQFDFIDIERFCGFLEIGVNQNEHENKILIKEENLDYEGSKYISKLYNHIHYKQSLRIIYKPFEKEPQQFYISPYFLKEYNNRWFLICKNKDYDDLTILALDRIEEVVEDQKGSYEENNGRYDNDYFYDIVGVTIPEAEKVQEVKLKIKKHIWGYIKSKPIHPSQSGNPPLKGDFYEVKYKIKPNKEFNSKILGWGDGITVLKPDKLRLDIKKTIQKMNNNYYSAD